jgi:hypothetical protein
VGTALVINLHKTFCFYFKFKSSDKNVPGSNCEQHSSTELCINIISVVHAGGANILFTSLTVAATNINNNIVLGR